MQKRRNAEHLSNGTTTNAGSIVSHCISLAAVLKGTNNIHGSLVVGDGGFGNVYRGIVTDGTIAAVNRNNPMFRQVLRKFQNEIKML